MFTLNKNTMKKIIVGILAFFVQTNAHAFCGFYVAKADTKIFNHRSQVIMVRNGNTNTITMSNDFKGNVRDFAIVVPVPVVLAKNDIRVKNNSLFDKLDAYSAPRLVEYFDENPCEPRYRMYKNVPMAAMADNASVKEEVASAKKMGVRIEARYAVGEYDILILSAKESNGLKTWLNQNGYKIPEQANEVLDPYIRSNMKFFVAKVNLQRHQAEGFEPLKPIQISFNSPKFMLPIRLGMANSDGHQDLIVYALSAKGRVECTNYRTVKMPTGQNMPEFIQNDFGKFYGDVFQRQWLREGQSAVFQEYAWDVSPSNFVKCDPCVSDPPDYTDLAEAGANWMNQNNNYDETTKSTIFFTRLHVRYDRAHFAQDLVFQETPDTRNWQVRYVLNHPAGGSLNCSEGTQYIASTINRRHNELNNLQRLAGWSATRYGNYPYTWEGQQHRLPRTRQGHWSMNWPAMLLFIGLQISVLGVILMRKR